MLDWKYIGQNAAAVQRNVDNRFLADPPVVEEILQLRRQHGDLQQELEALRQQRRQNAAAAKQLGKTATEDETGGESRQELAAVGKRLKAALVAGEARYQQLDTELQRQGARLPNMTHPDAPIGKEESQNVELYRVGQIAPFSFAPKGHLELMQGLDLVDFESAARVAGAKHYYLKNEAVFLELSLTRFAADTLQRHGFTLCITPELVREQILSGIGFQPRGPESNTYLLQDEDLCLIGTAEIPLGGMYSGQIVELKDKPILLGGLSHCFRKEAGAAGQYSKGLYRVHQFSKVEMFIFCKPEESEAMHGKLLAIEEEIFRALEIPYRVVDICSGDLGAPAYRKYDLEAWMPGRGPTGDWGEVTSASNCTDYQSRRLGIRFRPDAGGGKPAKPAPVHTLNGTAIALSRAIIALLENHQQADGSIRLPQVLQPYMGCKLIAAKDAT